MESQLLFAPTDDGLALAVGYHAPPAGVPERGAAWIGHAILCNRRTLDHPPGHGLASVFAARGWHVYTFDFRGHGQSGRWPAAGDDWAYDDLVRFDLPAIARFVRQRHLGLPLAGIGHSLGGHSLLAWHGLASSSGARPAVDALVGLGTNVWLKRFEASRRLWGEKRAWLGYMRMWARARGYVPARAFRAGTEDLSAACIEQFVQWATSDRWTSRDGAVDYAALLSAHRRAPLLLVAGAGDALECTPGAAARFAEAVDGERPDVRRVELRIVGHASGLELDPDHMGLVTRRKMSRAWVGIAGWLDAVVPRP